MPEDLEERYGFVFGTPDGVETPTHPAKHLKTAVCVTRGCDRYREVGAPIHEDTVQPVRCGGCGTVLHCDHKLGEQSETIMGTISAPRLLTTRYCVRCGTLLESNERDLPPVRFEDLPASTLRDLGVAFMGQ